MVLWRDTVYSSAWQLWNHYHWQYVYTKYCCEQLTFSVASQRASRDSWNKLWCWHWQHLAKPAHRINYTGLEITVKWNKENTVDLLRPKQTTHIIKQNMLLWYFFSVIPGPHIYNSYLLTPTTVRSSRATQPRFCAPDNLTYWLSDKTTTIYTRV